MELRFLNETWRNEPVYGTNISTGEKNYEQYLNIVINKDQE